MMVYPLVNVNKKLRKDERSTILMGKSTISMAMFNRYVTNYQRVTVHICPRIFWEPFLEPLEYPASPYLNGEPFGATKSFPTT